MAATKKITCPIKPIEAGIKAAMAATTPPIVEINDAINDTVEICRNESCTIVEIHEAHRITSTRGAPPKDCPSCLAPIPRGQGAKCTKCGWDRRGQTFVRRRRKNGEQDA